MRLDAIVEHLSHRYRIGIVVHALVETSRRSAPHQAIPEGIGRGLVGDSHALRLAGSVKARLAGGRLRLDGALAPTRHARSARTPCDTCTPRGADTGTPCVAPRGPRSPSASRKSRGTTCVRGCPARSCRSCRSCRSRVSRGPRRPTHTRRSPGLSGLRTRTRHETQSHTSKPLQEGLHGRRASTPHARREWPPNCEDANHCLRTRGSQVGTGRSRRRVSSRRTTPSPGEWETRTQRRTPNCAGCACRRPPGRLRHKRPGIYAR